MTLLSAASLAFALFVLASTPGPGVFATVSRALASGFIPALAVISGIILGDIIFLFFAVLGMSFIAKTLGSLFILVKILGGAYLVYLGFKILRQDPGMPGKIDNENSTMKANFLAGLFITLSNPKVIIFYCTFLPGFMDLSSLESSDIIVVILLVVIVLFSVLAFYAFLANRARKVIKSRRANLCLNRSAGLIMMATGVTIAVRA